MKKILTIIIFIILLSSCSNKEIDSIITNSNQVSFYSEDDNINYLTFTFDDNDVLEFIYMTYVFDDNETAKESISVFSNNEELFESIGIEGNKIIIKYLPSTYLEYEDIYKDSLIEELEKDNYIRK